MVEIMEMAEAVNPWGIWSKWILLVYLAGLILLTRLLRRWKPRARSFLIVGYNYLFAVPLTFYANILNGYTGDGLSLLMRCAYLAPKALTFGADLSLFEDPFITLLFYIMSLYTIRAVLLAFFHKAFIALAMRLRILWNREIFAVRGEVDDAKALIREIRARKPRAAILFIPQRDADRDAKVMALIETRPWKEILKPNRRYHILLLPDSKNNNLLNLDALEAHLVDLEEHDKKIPNLRVTAFLENDMLRFENLKYPHLDVYLVSREQLLTRGFFTKEHLPLHILQQRGEGSFQEGIYRPSRPFSLCVLGLNALSREFLLTTWENAAFHTDAPDGRGLSALIMDSDMQHKRAFLLLDAPQLGLEPGFTWLDAEPDSEEGIDAICARLGEFHQILIATEDTKQNLDTAMRLLRLFRHSGMVKNHPQLVVALYESADGSSEFLTKEAGGKFLRIDNSQFTYDELIKRETDQMAEQLHQKYNKQSMHNEKWKTIGTFKQNSNRAVIWDIDNKLLLADDLTGKTPEEREAIYWKLSEYEHLRWNVFHYTHGWVTLPKAELTEDEIRACATKREDQKRHACIVPWDELDGLPQARPGLLKRYDYENVLQLFDPNPEN